MNDITGFIPENELEELVAGEEDRYGGTLTPSSWPCIIGAVTVTANAGGCPTSACTRRCNS
ncbi:class II lanthipeptide, LchA2/BrtA2 family [Sanguibacter sp. 25GB23B1]|uniref:class II lanthipeptide, LchA2/BrtA2 family n=1 Tax=unclassified Sanguibacter TaxID=2645534 RepID=UPI0032AEABB1